MDLKTLLKGSFVNIDKPEGPTSHDVDLWLRKILKVEKTSHFGTLDPMVTGVLPIAVGKAVKLFQYFKSGKEYVGVMHFHEDIERGKVEEAIKRHFLGKITQLPPVKSRVKREERQREIYKFEILEQDGRDFLFIVDCEAGTYIRKLCHDLGEYLKIGAHMTELRRTRAGRFYEKDSFTLYDLTKAAEEYEKGNEEPLKKMLIPKEIVTEEIKAIEVNKSGLKKIGYGSPLTNSDIAKKAELIEGEKIAITFNKEVIAIAKSVKHGNVIARPETVLLN